ncbi:hypothetical protein VPH35_139576 [Triticum aestivum]
MVLVSAPVGPRPVYDSDVEVVEPEILTDPIVERLNLVEEENNYLKEKIKKIEEKKVILELHVADVVDDHKIKMDAMRLKIRKIMPLVSLCHSYRGLVSLCRWINCYLGCDYDRICFRIEMFYIVSMYGLIN